MHDPAPEGRRVVWARDDRPAVEGAPSRLPGVVVVELDDGWVQVAWPAEDGWRVPDAVYETSSLTDVDPDEFDRLVEAVRDSGWAGVPVPEPPPHVTRLVVGDRVRWVGPLPGEHGWDPEAGEWQRGALGGVLTRSHPGTVVETSPWRAARVRWVDRAGELEGTRRVREDWLEPVDEAEHARLAARLRASDWPGLPGSGPRPAGASGPG